MTFLEAGFRPEVLLFPEFLLMEDFELHQHGRIPETRLVAAGMNSSLGLASVRMRFSEALGEAGWSMGKVEMAKQSFRMLATLGVEELEIRAVQGGADTQVFLLYLPPPPAVDVPMDMNGRTL
ncbi:hypothetical protein [Pontiella sp.]|uniref:hypothetical protein n=1 Tax=Pontiella sp. TaxID=2837462 RepID=UPI003568141E